MYSLLMAFKKLLGCEDLGTLGAREATTVNLRVVLTGVNVQACLAPKSRWAYITCIGLDIGITVVLLQVTNQGFSVIEHLTAQITVVVFESW